MKLMMIFSFIFFSQQLFGLEKQLIEEYKKIRSIIEDNKFAISNNYYFLLGSVTVEDYEDDIEFIAETNAYENLDVYAFNQICWPDYLNTETKVKIFYRYLEVNPLFVYNQNITILKKEKKPNDIINIIYVFDRKSNKINFPNTEMLGFINSC
ncbi:hypothetical protein OAK12_01735 [Alphaproteobacteria bacterium]|nr:hypothetical protein [Alphaproteobacteria bacterium]